MITGCGAQGRSIVTASFSRSGRPPCRPSASVSACSSSGRGSQVVQQESIWPKLVSGLASVALSTSLLLALPEAADAGTTSLPDLMRPELGFLDANNDGVLGLEELQEGLPDAGVPVQGREAERAAEYYLHGFDLDGSGTLATDEFLGAAALDVNVDEGSYSRELFQIFDADRSGSVDHKEWVAGLGALASGRDGDVIAEYAFRKADYMSSSNGALRSPALGDALLRLKLGLGMGSGASGSGGQQRLMQMEDAQFLGGGGNRGN